MVLSRTNTVPAGSVRGGVVTAHGVAEIAGLTVWRVQELDRQRRVAQALADTGNVAERAAARKYLRREALPAPVRTSPRPRVWSARAVRAWAERTERTVGGVPQPKSPPGRPAGGPPVIRRKRALLGDQLAAFDAVEVPDELAHALRPLVDRLYARWRARGVSTDEAREQAAVMAAQSLGCEVAQARKVALMVAVGRRRPNLAQLVDVAVPEASRGRLLPALQAAVARWRAAGATIGDARAGAVEQVAADANADVRVVWKVLLEAVYALT